jgi:hypothetical protein
MSIFIFRHIVGHRCERLLDSWNITIAARICTAVYFAFFLLMPIYTRWEKTKPLPNRVNEQPSIEDHIPAIKESFAAMTHDVPKDVRHFLKILCHLNHNLLNQDPFRQRQIHREALGVIDSSVIIFSY